MGFEELWNEVVKIANEEFDGHFTIMKFTTHWKGSFGTPTSETMDERIFFEPEDRRYFGLTDKKAMAGNVAKWPKFKTFNGLARYMIRKRPNTI